MLISIVWKFVRKEWKTILLAFLIILTLLWAANSLIEYGENKADAAWIVKNNKQVKAFNAKIAQLEADSRTEAKRLKEDRDVTEKRLAEVLAAGPTIVLRDVKGNPLKCDGKEVVPYLGQDFSDQWNRLNEEGAMK